MPLFRFGTSPADTTPILITNQELNSNGYDFLKGTVGYEDTVTLADNVDGTLLLQPNSAPAGPNARTLWVKDFNGTNVLSADIFTDIVTLNNVIITGTASINVLARPGSAIPNLVVSGTASINNFYAQTATIGTLDVNNTTAPMKIVGTVNATFSPASWTQSLILDDLATSTNNIFELRVAGVRRGSIRVDNLGNLVLNGSGTGQVFFNNDECTGGTAFGNGAFGVNATIDSSGRFSGLLNVTGSFALSTSTNMNGVFPNFGGTNAAVIGSNFTNGQSEIDFINTFNSPLSSFRWYQQTGAAAATLIQTMYPSGGVFVGTTPSDPGANNFQAQGRIIGNAVGASAKTHLNFVPLTNPTGASVTHNGGQSNVAISLSADVPSSAVAVSIVITWVATNVGDNAFVTNTVSPSNIKMRVNSEAATNTTSGGVIPIASQQLFYTTNVSPGNWTLTITPTGYYEPA